jgi:putative nucleotidyltransferase with HDIG domain
MSRVLVSSSVALVLAAPLAAFFVMTNFPGMDPAVMAPTQHFWIVSLTSFLAGVIGAGFMISVGSLRSTRSVFLALGFVAVAVIFAMHGLGTPGFIVPVGEKPYAVIVSAGLSEVVGAVFIALSVMPARWLPGRVETWAPAASVVGLLALGAYVAVTLVNPEFWAILPESPTWDTFLAFGTIGLLSFAMWRYWTAWRLTRMPAQFAMVAALALLAESQVSMYYGTLWHASWWLYHGLMLVAFLTLVAGWAVEAKRARSLVLFSRALTLREELGRVDLAKPETLVRLEAAMANKDEHTRDHMGRVAVYSVAMARELGCDPATIALVETAGRIHDIGKIVVPDAVLLKPGKLTTQEFDQMKHHAARGAQIALASKVLAPVAEVMRAHHERFAGNGYPDGHAGERIPLAARIVAVADTFDAITSPRVYRGPRPPEEAIAELQRVSGTQLDPQCVNAFVAWWQREGRRQGQVIPIEGRLRGQRERLLKAG